MLTWIVEFRPGNKTIWIVVDEESEFSGPRTPKLSLDQVFLGNRNLQQFIAQFVVLLISYFSICSGGGNKSGCMFSYPDLDASFQTWKFHPGGDILRRILCSDRK